MSTETANDVTLDDAKGILKGFTIPAQPKLLTDIRAAYPDIEKIAGIISTDPGISSSVLKTVNSPLFRRGNAISSINHAVVMLGLNSVMNIINAVMLKTALTESSNTSALDSFWNSATDVANAAAMVARQLNLALVDESYTLGLFHNCGIPLMLQRFDNYLHTLGDAYAYGCENLTNYENDAHTANHAVIGYYVTKSWQLKPEICEVIRIHHNLDDFVQTASQKHNETLVLFSILKMAEHISKEHLVWSKQASDLEWERVSKSAQEVLGISAVDFDELSDLVSDYIDAAKA